LIEGTPGFPTLDHRCDGTVAGLAEEPGATDFEVLAAPGEALIEALGEALGKWARTGAGSARVLGASRCERSTKVAVSKRRPVSVPSVSKQ
jgi:hypothetical protein